eukprot:1308204-Alexandrium_andersonii.AAC.1
MSASELAGLIPDIGDVPGQPSQPSNRSSKPSSTQRRQRKNALPQWFWMVSEMQVHGAMLLASAVGTFIGDVAWTVGRLERLSEPMPL